MHHRQPYTVVPFLTNKLQYYTPMQVQLCTKQPLNKGHPIYNGQNVIPQGSAIYRGVPLVFCKKTPNDFVRDLHAGTVTYQSRVHAGTESTVT